MKLVKTVSFELAIYEKGDPNSKKLALVLPGRLDTKDYIHITSLVEKLAQLGFYAISFDPPGSWESSGNYSAYSTTNYLTATNELIQKLGNRPTFLAGHSRGGANAMLASAANDCVKGLALIMASYANASAPMSGDIKNGEYITTRDLPPGHDKNAPRKEMKLSLDYFKDSKKFKPVQALQEFTGPKLLIAASQDEFTPPNSVKNIYDKLSEPKEYIEIDSYHDYRFSTVALKAVNDAVTKFVQTSVK